MIKITDGVNVKIVTKGVFNNLYSKLGYVPVVDKPVKEEKPVVEKVDEPVIKHEEVKRAETKKGKK